MKNGSMKKTAEFWINKLNLKPHPEGGYFSEIYKSDICVDKNDLPDEFNDCRSLVTSIYYLLSGNDISRFHRLKSDEIWHYYDGSALLLHIIDEKGNLTKQILGNDKDDNPVIIIKKNQWFAAEIKDKSAFSLTGCTVSPGFDFDDLEFAATEKLIKLYPQHSAVIKRFT
jgi:predicted cupin superfamily sugar epimerase